MKVAASAFVVLAASGHATASWLDWSGEDATVTETLTRTVQYCPCNGEVRVTPVSPAEGVQTYTKTGAVNPAHTTPTGPRTITKAGPIVVVYTTEGYLTTKTGVAIELHPTGGAPGATVTKTIWTGPQPTNDLAWVDWTDDDAEDGATLTRTHTEFTTVFGPAPTSDEPEPWSDWVATTNSVRTTSTTSSGNVGPIGGSTTSSHGGYWSSSTSVSSSSGNGVGPIGGSTTTPGYSSSTTFSTSVTTSSGGDVGPIGGSTTTTSSLTSTTPISSTTAGTTTTSDIGSPILQTTTTTSASTTDIPVTTTSAAVTTTTPVATTSTLASTTTTAGTAIQTVNVGTDYISGILLAHNLHRANHSAADLSWSANLATIAGQTAATCVYRHDVTTGGGGYGQNIGAGYTPLQVPGMIGNDMYNREMPFYPGPYDSDNVDLTNFGSFGHFTQIVWKGTQQVGCATQYCPQGLTNAAYAQYFTVCNYYPPGNIVGAYSNVGAPLGEPITVVVAQ